MEKRQQMRRNTHDPGFAEAHLTESPVRFLDTNCTKLRRESAGSTEESQDRCLSPILGFWAVQALQKGNRLIGDSHRIQEQPIDFAGLKSVAVPDFVEMLLDRIMALEIE